MFSTMQEDSSHEYTTRSKEKRDKTVAYPCLSVDYIQSIQQKREQRKGEKMSWVYAFWTFLYTTAAVAMAAIPMTMDVARVQFKEVDLSFFS